MRKSATHLKDVSGLFLAQRSKMPTMPACCWKSHVRAMFDILTTHHNTPSIPQRSPWIKTRSCRRSFATSVMTVKPVHEPLCDRRRPPKKPVILPPALPGPLAVFNLSNHVVLADLEQAIQRRHSEKAWSLFTTVVSRKDEMYVPFDLCLSLHSLLDFAKALAGPGKPSEYRKKHIDQLHDYVGSVFGISREEFITHAEVLPLPREKLFEHFLRLGNRRRAWAVYYQMKKDGDSMKSISRSSYFKLLSFIYNDSQLDKEDRAHRAELVGRIHAGIEDSGRVLSGTNICRIGKIYALYDRGARRKAHAAVEVMISEDLSRDVVDELVWRVLEYDDVKMAEYIIQTVHQQQPGMRQNETLYTNLIDVYRRCGDYEAALKLFESMLENRGKPKARLFNALLRVFAEQNATDRMSHLYDIMIQLNIPPDAASFSEMIRANAQANRLEECLRYYDMMKAQDVKPNAYTYSILIDAYAAKRDIKGVIGWFQTMLEEKVEPNEVIISCVLQAFRRQWDPHVDVSQLIFDIAHHAMQAGIRADATLYTILLEVQSKQTGMDGAITIHKQMLDRCIMPSIYTYTTLIELCGNNGKADTAEKIFELMKNSAKLRPNTVTYCSLLDAWTKARRFDKVAMLVKDFLKQCKSERSSRLWIDAKMRYYIHGPSDCPTCS